MTAAYEHTTYADEVAAPRDLSPVTVVLKHTREMVEALHAEVDRIERRLEPVLGPERPHTIGGDVTVKDAAPVAPLVDEIDNVRARMQHAVARLSSITERLVV